MDEHEQVARVRLIRTRNIGPMTYSMLMARYGTAVAALAAIPEISARGGRKLQIASIAYAKAKISNNADLGAKLIWHDSEFFPPHLAQFDDAPACLSTQGSLHLLQRPMIAIVGARNASINAMRFAEKIAADLGDAGYVIVSGMARGIDAAAHHGAMPTGTIGVIAGGIDIIYPPENRGLYAEIKTKRLLLAEMPPSTAPTPRHFPTRNRIIASLAMGVLVVEAATRSGSLITTREAAERGGDVMAVPGSPLDPRADGCNRLIREGAILVQSAADVIEHVSNHKTVEMPPPQTPWHNISSRSNNETDISLCRDAILAGLSGEPVEVEN